MAGLIRWVRARRPCRPGKLRLLVLATRSPGPADSPFIAGHSEQPLSRHWKPASVKMRSSPSASAARFTPVLPGLTVAGTFAMRSRSTAAAARRSSIRLLVHEPMKMFCTSMSVSAMPGSSPM